MLINDLEASLYQYRDIRDQIRILLAAMETQIRAKILTIKKMDFAESRQSMEKLLKFSNIISGAAYGFEFPINDYLENFVRLFDRIDGIDEGYSKIVYNLIKNDQTDLDRRD